MPAEPVPILLAAAGPCPELADALSRAGYAVEPAPLDLAKAGDPGMHRFAVVEATGRADDAAGFVRRWKGRCGPHTCSPVLWLGDPADRSGGLHAGADATLTRPFEEAELIAQAAALNRVRRTHDTMLAHATQSSRLNSELRVAYQQLTLDYEVARHIQQVCLPRGMPEVGRVRFAVAHRPRGAGGDFYHVSRLDETRVGFYVGDAMGHSLASCLLAIYVKQIVVQKEIRDRTYRLLPVDELLQRLNRDLIGLQLSDPPFVRLTCGLLDCASGDLTYACAGHTPPLHLPQSGPPSLWRAFGSMLGVSEAEHPPRTVRLVPGDRLLLFTDGLHGTGPETAAALLTAAERHRDRPIAGLVECLTQDLLAQTAEPDDFTMLGLEVSS